MLEGHSSRGQTCRGGGCDHRERERLLMEPGGMPAFYGDRVGQGWREGRGGETGMRSKPPAAARRTRQSGQMLLRCLFMAIRHLLTFVRLFQYS